MRYFLLMVFTLASFTVSAYETLSETKRVESESSKLQLTEDELTWIEDNKLVTVIGDADWFPFEGVDKAGNYVGIVAEVLDLATQKTGINFDFSGTSTWQHAIQLSQSQQIDIISASATNSLLEENYRPTLSTIKNPIVMVARSSMQYIPSLNSVKGLRIALANNSGYGNAIFSAYPDINFIEVENLDQALLGVANKKYDIALMSMALASYQIAELGLEELRVVGITELDMELTLFVNRNKPVLWQIINKVKLHETDLERNEIMTRWVKQKYSSQFSPGKVRALILVILVIILFVFHRQYLLKKQSKALEQLGQRDVLTNTHNRPYLDKVFSLIAEHSNRYKSTFSVLMIDIDHFKLLNELHGNSVGDKVLKQLVLLIEDNIRQRDLFGRWNGEVFVIICPETHLHEALILAEKLREVVADSIFLNVGKKTASFGVSEYRPTEAVEHCIARADRALHVAKSGGQNQVRGEEG